MALDPLPGVRCLRGTESREAAPLDWPRYLLVPPLRSAGGRRAYALLPPYAGGALPSDGHLGGFQDNKKDMLSESVLLSRISVGALLLRFGFARNNLLPSQ